MKIIKKIAILSIVLLLNGCSNFLEPDSLSTFDSNLVFSNLDDARKATNNVYRQFGEGGFRTRLSITMQGITDIMAGGDKNSTKANYNIMALKADSNNGDLNAAWNTIYAGIKDCNFVINGILNSPIYNSLDPAVSSEMHQYIGEAYAIRAYWYSQLAYNWGDVPYYRDAPKAGDNFDLPKTDRNEILSDMIDDLIAIEPTMKWADQLPQACQQVNREYAIGMIARLSLQRAGYYLQPDLTLTRPADDVREKYYKLAKEYCQKLITLKDRVLPSDFLQIFKNQCNSIYPVNSDMLFEVPFSSSTGEVGYNVGMTIDGNALVHNYGKGAHDYGMPLSYFYSFDNKDIRLKATCGLYDLKIFGSSLLPNVVSNTGIGQAKWSKEYCNPPLGGTNTQGTGINWPMMRYPDVLLMLAEAENELNGPTQLAKDMLARVRRRAFDIADHAIKVDAYINTVSNNKADFFKAIVDERAWEFGGELLRKNDLIRWGLYEAKMLETVNAVKSLGDMAVVNSPNANRANYIYWKIVNGVFVYDHEALYTNKPPLTGTINSPNITGVLNTPVGTWNRSNWINGFKNANTGIYISFLDNQYSPYIESSPVRYIQPIPILAINNSLVLKNDGYGFTN